MQKQQEQKQSSRYEFYICNNPDIYWWTNSIDKPSDTIFKRIIYNSNWIKVNTPNFINAFTAEFVVDKKDYYNYAKLVDTVENKTTYWFFNTLQKTLRNAFLYELKMDVFASYGYNFINQAFTKDLSVFVNRSNAYRLLESSQVNSQIDELLPVFNSLYPLKLKYSGPWLPAIVDDVENPDVFSRRTPMDFTKNGESWTPNAKGKIFKIAYAGTGGAVVNNLEIVREYADVASTDWYIDLNTYYDKWMNLYCDVYALNNTDLLLIPINNSLTQAEIQIGREEHYPNKRKWFDIPFGQYSRAIELRNEPNLINKYKGCYCIEFPIHLLKWCKGLCTLGKKDQDGLIGIECGGFLIPISTAFAKNINRYHQTSSEIINDVVSTFTPNTDKINKYVLSKFTQMISGERWCSYFNDDLSGIIEYDYNYISGFKFYTGLTFKKDKNNGIVYNSGETLPIIVDEYQKYLTATLSQRNTNLEIHNRDATIGIAQSVVGGVFNTIGGIASGMFGGGLGAVKGALGAATAGINAGFDIYNSINKYKDYQKRENSALADKQRASTTSITLSTNEKSNLFHKLNKLFKYGGDGISNNDYFYTNVLWLNGYAEQDVKTIQAANKIVWENGFKIGMNIRLQGIGNLASEYVDEYANIDFLYWDWKFNDEYFKLIYPTLDVDLLNTIKMSVNGEIRFWNINKPNYNAPIKTNL